MIRRTWTQRLTLGVAAMALVLKAAVPLLAATAASLQGVPVARICPIYGVDLPQTAPVAAHGAELTQAGDAASQASAAADEAAFEAAYAAMVAPGPGSAAPDAQAASEAAARPLAASTSEAETGASGPAHEHGEHGGHAIHEHDHCALCALASIAPPAAVDAPSAPDAPSRQADAALPRLAVLPDACALWVARLKHGPPHPAQA
jgi:hypothetical protein